MLGFSNSGNGFPWLAKNFPRSCSKLREIIIHFDPVSTSAVTDTPSISILIQGDKPTAFAVQLLVVTVYTSAELLVKSC